LAILEAEGIGVAGVKNGRFFIQSPDRGHVFGEDLTFRIMPEMTGNVRLDTAYVNRRFTDGFEVRADCRCISEAISQKFMWKPVGRNNTTRNDGLTPSSFASSISCCFKKPTQSGDKHEQKLEKSVFHLRASAGDSHSGDDRGGVSHRWDAETYFSMLMGALFLIWSGADRFSVDAKLGRRAFRRSETS